MKKQYCLIGWLLIGGLGYAGGTPALVDAPERFPKNERYDVVFRQNFDLSRSRYFAFDAYVEDPGAVDRGTCYFLSGKGACGIRFAPAKSGWNRVVVDRAMGGKYEGAFAGWSKVRGVKITFWWSGLRTTKVDAKNPQLMDEKPLAAVIDNRAGGERVKFFERMCKSFDAAGIPTTVIDESDLSADALSGLQLVALPGYASHRGLKPAGEETLAAFAARGGKVLRKTWKGLIAGEDTDGFAEILKKEVPAWRTRLDAATAARHARAARAARECAAAVNPSCEQRWVSCHEPFGPPVEGWDWDRAAKFLADNGIHGMEANLCRAGVAFYESKVLPVSEKVAEKGDQLKAFVAACRKYGLECRVWRVCWNTSHPRFSTPESRKWIADGLGQVSFEGKRHDSYLCPSAPENREREIASMYELAAAGVDVISFDYIRYPDRNHCFCDRCRQAFEAAIGEKVPNWPADVRRDARLARLWKLFRDERISSVVEETSRRVRKSFPKVKIVASVLHGDGDGHVKNLGQPWKEWVRRGWLDYVVPMAYFEDNDVLRACLREQIRTVGVDRMRPILGPSLWMDDGVNVERLAEQVRICREEGLKGFGLFVFDYRLVRDLPKMGFATRWTVNPPSPGGFGAMKTPETSSLFERHVDPANGVVSYRLKSGLADENQQSTYFTCDSMTEDGRFLIFTACKNEFTHPELAPVTREKLGRRTVMVDFAKDGIVDFGIDMGIPFVDAKTDQLWYVRKNGGTYRGGAICRRDLKVDPMKDVVECEIPSEIFAGVTNEHYLTTHITLTRDRRRAFVAVHMDDRFEQGMIDFGTGRWEKWGSTPFYANHDQLCPADDNLALVAWEDCWKTPDARAFMRERGWYPRLWLLRSDGSREFVPSRIINNATHERWTQDGKGFYFCAPGSVGGSGVIYHDLATGRQECVCPRRCMHATMTRDGKYVVYDNYKPSPKYFRGRAFEVGFWNRSTRRGLFVQPMGEPLATPEKPSILHPDGHPTFVGGDRYVVWTVTNADGHMDLALAPVEPLVTRTAKEVSADAALFTGKLSSGIEALPGDGSVDFHDVLVVGGTVKGVEAAIAARNLDGFIPERVQLLTPYSYLGEDMAGTLELGFGEAVPTGGLRRAMWESSTDHAAFDYWEDPKCTHPQFVYRNDRLDRLSEPGRPPSDGDAVYHYGDVNVKCVLRKKSDISTVEVIVLEGKERHGDQGATASVTGEFLDGPRKGEKVAFVRREAGFDVGSLRVSPVSFVADVGSEIGEFNVTVRKDPAKKCQYLSRVWFHLSGAERQVGVPAPLKVKRTLDRALINAGVDFMTSTAIEDVIRDKDGKIVGVVAVNRSGRRTYRAKKVIDATRYGLLEGFGKPFRVGAKERFSRVVVVGGDNPPRAPGVEIEKLPGEFRLSHAKRKSASAYRYTMEIPMKDGSFASFAAAERRFRDVTWNEDVLDDADLLVWHRRADAVRSAPPVPPARYDVVVVGGGTSGTPAAIAAARSGAKVLLVEYLSVLGGVGTDGMICGYYDGNHCGFTAEFKSRNAKIMPGGGYYARSETWRRMCEEAGVEVWYAAMGTGAVMDGGKVVGVRVGTEHGPVVVRTKCVIDATGNSDIAASAGAATEFIGADEFALQSAGQSPHRLARSGINSDFGYLDDSNADDLWLFMLRARAGAPNAWDIAKMPDSRERRRIISDLFLSAQDVSANRTFPDTVVQALSRQDAHGYIRDVYAYVAPDSGTMKDGLSGRWRVQFSVNVPLRSLLPKGLSGIAVIGVGAGVERDVQPIIRMQADLMNMGYSVGVAAAMAAANGGDFRAIDSAALKAQLVEKGILRREVLDWTADTDVSSDAVVAAAVASLKDDFKGADVIWRAENRARALPGLRAAYRAATDGKTRQIYAEMLGMLGDATGVETLAGIVSGKIPVQATRHGANFGEGNNGGDNIRGFMIALGRTRDARALEPLLTHLRKLTSLSPLEVVRSATLGLGELGSPGAAAELAAKLQEEGNHGFAVSDWRKLKPQGGYGGCPEMVSCLRELAYARALLRCGDFNGLARKTFKAYAKDPRGVLSAYARAVLKEYGK